MSHYSEPSEPSFLVVCCYDTDSTTIDAAVNSGELWFVNFYFPRCHHCHELAPTVILSSLTVKVHSAIFYAIHWLFHILN